MLLKPLFSTDMDYAQRRRKLIRVGHMLGQRPMGSRLKHQSIGGRPAEWLTHDNKTPSGTLLYLHGGAYVAGAPLIYRRFLSRLAKRSGLSIVTPDYRLAPEHPYPAAVNDAVAAYRELLEQNAPQPIFIGGDSAGGGLTLATALALRDTDIPPPAGLILLSPWTDLTLSGDSVHQCAERELILDAPSLKTDALAYAGHHDLKTPGLSPLFADLTGLPPTLIQVGGHEVLRDDARRISSAAAQAGVPVTLQEWSSLWHVWQALAGLLPEANDAVAKMVDFIAATRSKTSH